MKNWNIQTRVLLMALLPGMLASVLLGSYFIADRSNDLDDLLKQRALAMAKQLAPTCEYGIMTGNNGILQNIANNMLEEHDVRSVSIYNEDVDILAHAGPKMLTEQLGSAQLSSHQLQLLKTQGSIRVRAPVFAENLIISEQVSDQFFAEQQQPQELLGWAEVELSTANTQLARYQHIAQSLSIIAVILVVSSLLAMRFSRQLSLPINHLVKTIDDMAGGKLDSRAHLDPKIHPTRHSEFQQLAKGINAMANALQRANNDHMQNLEQATRDLQETLDDMEIRNRQLQISKEEAIEASQMKSRFLANVSHEIRTPLNGVLGFSDLLARSQISHQQGSYVNTIRRSANDLLRIINDILDLSKIEAEKLILEHAPFDLRDVIEEVLTVTAPEAYAKGLALTYQLDDSVPFAVGGDSLRLKQILLNLVNNAIKFTEHGAIHIGVDTISHESGRATIEFAVHDSGIGLNDQQLDKLFQAFAQADASTARQFGGTGLGLIISKALAKAMQGDIKVTSQLGQGSCFTLYVRLDISQSRADDKPQPLRNKHLLLLEPDAQQRQQLLQLFQQWQLAPVCYISDSEQLQSADNDQADALLISVDRRRLHQQQTAQWLAGLSQRPYPLIVLVNSMHHTDLQWLRDQGVCAAISLPLVRAQLHQQLCSCLGLTEHLPASNTPMIDGQQVQQRAAPKVLAVDDNDANLKLVCALLTELGVQVYAASSGQQAIEMAARHSVEMVLMDIQMPNMNGLEASQHIRRLPGLGALPIIALTAHALADEKETLLNNGLNDYQTKPITLEQLAACIEQWTGYRPQQQSQTPALQPENQADAAELALITNADSADCTDNSGIDNNDIDNKGDSALAVFDAYQALKLTNYKADLAVDLQNMLLGSVEEELAAIRDAWEEEDFAALLEAVHKLHGASRYCGVCRLRQRLNDFESDLKQRNQQALPQHMRALVQDVADVQQFCQQQTWQQLLADAAIEIAAQKAEQVSEPAES